MNTSQTFCMLLAVPLLGLASSRAAAAFPDDRVPDGNLARGMITPEAQRAIDDGLQYLAQQQAADGSFGTGQFQGNVAITSLCGLAFLAGGHQPGRGKYGKVVSKIVDYILAQEEGNSGFLNNRRAHIHGPMYNHGFATLFLAEVHGMVPGRRLKDQVKDTLERAVKLTINSQSNQPNHEGGWRYRPVRGDADISVTICQIMALRAARNAGISVPKSTADECIKYVKRCQDPVSGGFRYQASIGGNPGFARTAAGVVALFSAGVYEGEQVTKGLEFLNRYRPGRGQFHDHETRVHYYYGHYYAAQAMWTAGGRYFRDWFPAVRDELMRRAAQGGHRQDNHWFDGTFCRHYCTAMALIILQIPNNYLPIFQR